MAGYILKRRLLAVPTLFAVLTLVFVLVRVCRAIRRRRILGDQASQEALAALRQAGCRQADRRAVRRLPRAIAVRGDFGHSMVTGKPVAEEVRKVLPHTIDLTVTSIVLGALIGVPLGVWSALHRNTWIDYVARLGSLLGLSFPAFVSAILMLLVFAIHWRWFPVISAGSLDDPVERLRQASRCPPSISPSSWPPMSRG